jgi:hypothetical protein
MQFKLLLLLSLLSFSLIKSIPPQIIQVPGLVLYVDMNFIESRSTELEHRSKYYKTLSKQLEAKVIELDSVWPRTNESVKTSDDLNKKRLEAIDNIAKLKVCISEKIKSIVSSIAKNRGASAVTCFSHSQFPYISEKYNITQETLDLLNKSPQIEL